MPPPGLAPRREPPWTFTIPAVEAGQATDEPALSLAGLRRDYGERTALDGVGFELARGETLLVLGPNGAGKTTLLRILATLLRPSGGEVRALGCSIPAETWNAQISMLTGVGAATGGVLSDRSGGAVGLPMARPCTNSAAKSPIAVDSI